MEMEYPKILKIFNFMRIKRILLFLVIIITNFFTFAQSEKISEIVFLTYKKYKGVYEKVGLLESSNKVSFDKDVLNELLFKDGLTKIQYKGKFGFIDSSGNVIINYKYNEVSSFFNGNLLARINNNYYIIDQSDSLIRKLEYDEITLSNTQQTLFPYRLGLKWGFLDSNFVEIIEPKYDILSLFENGISIITLNNIKGFINSNGKEIVSPSFRVLTEFYNGVAFFKSDTTGMINQAGEIKVIGNFDLYNHSELAILNLNTNSFIFLDTNGATIFDSESDSYMYSSRLFKEISVTGKLHKKLLLKSDQSIDKFYKDKFIIINNGEKGIIDTLGNIIVPCEYKYINLYGPEEYIVGINDKEGLYFYNEMVIDTIYNEISLERPLIRVSSNLKYGFINIYGDTIIPLDYSDNCGSANEGIIVVSKRNKNKKNNQQEEKFGYYNIKGEMLTPLIYDEGRDFFQGICAVKLDGKWGFINNKGTLIIPCIYDFVKDFMNEVAIVQLNGKWGLIDQYGNQIIDFKYDNFFDFSDGLAFVSQNNKWGAYDYNGNLIIPLIYDSASSFVHGKSDVELNGKRYSINKNGEIIIY